VNEEESIFGRRNQDEVNLQDKWGGMVFPKQGERQSFDENEVS